MHRENHRTPIFGKPPKFLFGTQYICFDDQRQYTYAKAGRAIQTSQMYQAHDCINHSGVTRMRAHLASYWLEYKNRDIEAYIESCEICASRKGIYGKRRHWPTCHYKRGKGLFDIIYVDFVSMPVSLTALAAISRSYLAQETVQLTPLEDFTASATWCQSLGSFIAPGDHKARVTSSDNTAQWRTLSSCCAKIETVNRQISWNPSHLLWTQQLIAPPAYRHTTWSLAVNPTSAYPNYPVMNPQTKALRHICNRVFFVGGELSLPPNADITYVIRRTTYKSNQWCLILKE